MKGSVFWLLLVRLALVALVTGFAAVSCGGTSGGQQGSGGGTTGGDQEASASLDHPSLGQGNAPVVLTEYADYQ